MILNLCVWELRSDQVTNVFLFVFVGTSNDVFMCITSYRWVLQQHDSLIYILTLNSNSRVTIDARSVLNSEVLSFVIRGDLTPLHTTLVSHRNTIVHKNHRRYRHIYFKHTDFTFKSCLSSHILSRFLFTLKTLYPFKINEQIRYIIYIQFERTVNITMYNGIINNKNNNVTVCQCILYYCLPM